ncbi:hypothetical protein Q7P37_003361 [Cladosporium fusiforme]
MTPPQATVEVEDFDFQYTGGSTSTVSTFFPHDWSPQSVMTAASTPDKSPLKVRETGPMLLPRVRAQDQIMGLGPDLVSMGHTRSTSLASNDFPMQFGGRLPTPQREQEQYINNAMFSMSSSSLAVPSHPSMAIEIAATSRPSMAHMRSRSASHVRSHSRNSSSSSIDASMLNRYGYPTYRQSPTPQPVGMVTPMSRTPSAMSFLAPIGGHVQSYPARRRTASPPANPSRLSVEINEPTDLSLDIEESSLLDYLTKPNPTPSLTRRTVEPRPSSRTDFWFDVRNVRSWSDFNMDTIAALPSFLDLLKVGVSARALPTPVQVNLSPETPAHLAELCAKHHAVKVNAALKVAQGEKHIVIRALASTSAGARQQPNFVASYQSDAEKTIYGDGRGRVVGIVRCFDQWHSGMRNESALHKINYLRALAHLHRCMREHGCRYGFIMTEIELVCVRAGGPVSEDSQVPLFGYLEIATPIQMSTSGLATDGELQMTADLALWYLHMLAKEEPLPGQYTWRMDVGGAAARSRSHHLPQDGWIPTVHQVDKREAKRARGWVFPNEPLSKREVGKKRQSTKS